MDSNIYLRGDEAMAKLDAVTDEKCLVCGRDLAYDLYSLREWCANGKCQLNKIKFNIMLLPEYCGHEKKVLQKDVRNEN